VKKTLLLLLLKFVAITVPLTWVWMNGGQQLYFRTYMWLARPILIWIGVTNFPPSLVRDRFINFIPFLALILITPRLSALRRCFGVAAGLVLLFFSQIGLTYMAWASFVRDGRTAESMSNYFPALVMSDAMPFVIWALLANEFLSDLVKRVVPGAAARTAPRPSPPPVRRGDD
jgi:hypothetical protein